MDVEKLRERAEDSIKKDNFDYAIDLLKNQILSLYPDDTESRKMLRACVRAKHKKQGKPGATSTLVPQIKLFIDKMMKKWDAVMHDCENILMADPANKAVLFTLAEAAAQAGYANTAIAQHQACLELDPRFVKSYRSLGAIYEHQGDLDQALECFQKVVKLDPSDGDAARKVKGISAEQTSGVFSANKGGHSRNLRRDADKQEDQEFKERVLRTEEDFLRAIDIERKELPTSKHADRNWKRIGEYYAKINRYEEAIEALEKAKELNPLSFDITVAIGDVRIQLLSTQLKKHEKAAKSGDAAAKKQYSATKKQLSEFKIEEYTRRVAQHPTDNDLRYQLGSVLFEAGDFQNSIEHLQRGTKSPRYKNLSFDLLGQAFYKIGEPNLAINQYRRALEAIEKGDRAGMAIQYNLAVALEATDKDEAISVYQQLLEQDINYKDVKKRLDSIRG